jgi:hypothetical protein
MSDNIFTGCMPALMTPCTASASRTSTPWCARAAS